MTQSTLRYLLALYRAQDALNNENDLSIVVRATARLRRVDPDQSILPALDAKIARLKIIAGLLDGTFCDDNVGS